MKRNLLFHPVFAASLIIYLVLFALKKAEIYLPFISDYAADFLTMPVVLTLALLGIRRSRADRRNYTFPWTYVAFAVAMYAFLFEFLFPRLTERFTADPWDILAYAMGGVVFYFTVNRKRDTGQ
ncbi:MAG: hypothetical protein AAGN35_06055 [Bacteroidota bacterium]